MKTLVDKFSKFQKIYIVLSMNWKKLKIKCLHLWHLGVNIVKSKVWQMWICERWWMWNGNAHEVQFDSVCGECQKLDENKHDMRSHKEINHSVKFKKCSDIFTWIEELNSQTSSWRRTSSPSPKSPPSSTSWPLGQFCSIYYF